MLTFMFKIGGIPYFTVLYSWLCLHNLRRVPLKPNFANFTSKQFQDKSD